MSADEAIATLAVAAKHNPAAFLAWAAVTIIQRPQDAATVKWLVAQFLK